MEHPDSEPLRRLLAHIAALETELARYAHKYGLTEEGRELLRNSPTRDAHRVH